MDKRSVRFKVLREHDHKCAICQELIRRDLAIHEWLVKRNELPKSQQEHIFDPINCVPLHNMKCHLPKGQTKRAAVQCFASKIVAGYTPMEIVHWYEWLRNDLACRGHGLAPLPWVSTSTSRDQHHLWSTGWKLLGMPDETLDAVAIEYGIAAGRIIAKITGRPYTQRKPIQITYNGGEICL